MTTTDPSDVATPATRAAATLGLDIEVRVIERARDIREAARRLDVPIQRLMKTLVVRRSGEEYLLVVVPGTRQIDWPKLRAHLGVHRLSMPDADRAREVTGYERGTITPLGTTRPLPTIIDASVAGGGVITIGGGAHGVSLRVDADALTRAIGASVADVSS